MRITVPAALCAGLIAASAAGAQQVVVNGGAPNQGVGWNIFDDNQAATSFSLGGATSFDGIDFWGILPQNTPYSPDMFWQIVLADGNTGLPGGTIAASGDAVATTTLDRELDAFPGFYSWQFGLGIAPLTLSTGTYWLMLHDGIVNPTPASLDAADGYTASNLIWETTDTPGQSAIQTFDVSSDWTDAGLGGLAFQLTSSAPPVMATPEPAPLVLFGTGLFAVGGVAAVKRRARRRTSAAATTLIAMIALPSLARAQSTAPPAPAVIHACYVPLTGTLYRIDETGLHQGCTSTTHVEFSWTDGLGAVRTTDALTGDLGGTFATPSVVGLQGHPLSTTAPAAGQVLTFDGSKWGPATASATFTNASVNGSFLATGTFGSGTIPATGSGVRMMWYPAKAAFRVGSAPSAEWDDEYVGSWSFAVGEGPIASGQLSTAIGEYAKATGASAVAIGAGATASGEASMALGTMSGASGYHSTALGAGQASGTFATALGNTTRASGDNSTAMGYLASTNGQQGSFVYGDASTESASSPLINAIAPNQFVVRAQHVWLGTNNNVTATDGEFLETSTGAYLSSGGMWTNVSDVNRKEGFRPIAGEDVLARLSAMPVKEWSYKGEDPSIRHIGPTAQDFYAAFHLGSSNTSIGTADADGVSLAAIKALEQRTRDLTLANEQLSSANAKLSSRLSELAAENAKLRAQSARTDARLDALEAAMANAGAMTRRP